MPLIEVANSEVLDKYSILEIKSQEIRDHAQLHIVETERKSLSPVANVLLDVPGVRQPYARLLEINRKIWHDMEAVYRAEAANLGIPHQLVVDIIADNRTRAEIKREIDTFTLSNTREAKSFF